MNENKNHDIGEFEAAHFHISFFAFSMCVVICNSSYFFMVIQTFDLQCSFFSLVIWRFPFFSSTKQKRSYEAKNARSNGFCQHI